MQYGKSEFWLNSITNPLASKEAFINVFRVNNLSWSGVGLEDQ